MNPMNHFDPYLLLKLDIIRGALSIAALIVGLPLLLSIFMRIILEFEDPLDRLPSDENFRHNLDRIIVFLVAVLIFLIGTYILLPSSLEYKTIQELPKTLKKNKKSCKINPNSGFFIISIKNRYKNEKSLINQVEGCPTRG